MLTYFPTIWSFSVPRIHSNSYCFRGTALAGPFFPRVFFPQHWPWIASSPSEGSSRTIPPKVHPHPSHSITVSCFIVFLKLISALLVYLVITHLPYLERSTKPGTLSIKSCSWNRCYGWVCLPFFWQCYHLSKVRITLKVTQVNQIHYSVVILNSLFEIFIPTWFLSYLLTLALNYLFLKIKFTLKHKKLSTSMLNAIHITA